jgi:hypothetical protein
MKCKKNLASVILLMLIVFLAPANQVNGYQALAAVSPVMGVHNEDSSTSLQAAASFSQTFDGNPAQPLPWTPSNWDVTVHSRDISTWNKLETMQAGHGSDCSPSPATHTVTEYKDAVFICKDHVMTAINASGYGVIYLTPNQLVDFTNGEAVIKFDLSTARTSLRDWMDVWISPYEDHLQLPLQDFYPDLSGEPRRAIQVEMGNFNRKTTFAINRIANFAATGLSSNKSYIGYESFLTPSAMRRDTFELHISRTHIKFGMPAYNFWWYDTKMPTLDWSVGVVQFGHHSYTPKKECATGSCGPNTWHWDNVQISPAVPFTIIRATQRYTDVKAGAQMTLAASAPANARLRFSGIGKSLQVSFDNGATWVKAVTQAQERYTEEAFWSYWMPIPAGTKTIKFKGTKWWGGDWRVQDLSVWAR